MLSVILTFYPSGLAEGVLLAMNQEYMRVVLKGSEDTVELRRVNGRWMAEDDQPVDFEALFTDGHADADLFGEAVPRTMAAGGL